MDIENPDINKFIKYPNFGDIKFKKIFLIYACNITQSVQI